MIHPSYNYNAPKYKPKIQRPNTQIVFDDDDEYIEDEKNKEKVKEKEILKDPVIESSSSFLVH
jgi:hypothetical protein